MITVAVDTEAPPSHRLNPLHVGCHSDSGFVHQVRGFHSQMIFGESFEKPQANCTYGESANAWSFTGCDGCNASSAVESSTVAPAMHGASSRRLSLLKRPPAGAAMLAVLSNRGLGNEGLFFEARKAYEGYFFARCAKPVQLVARLEDYTAASPPRVLAQRTFDFACGKDAASWVRLDFSLTPSAGAPCVGIAVGSDPNVHCTRAQPAGEAGHACVRCAGQFTPSASPASAPPLPPPPQPPTTNPQAINPHH